MLLDMVRSWIDSSPLVAVFAYVYWMERQDKIDQRTRNRALVEDVKALLRDQSDAAERRAGADVRLAETLTRLATIIEMDRGRHGGGASP